MLTWLEGILVFNMGRFGKNDRHGRSEVVIEASEFAGAGNSLLMECIRFLENCQTVL
jgi:hypothetical protein